MIAAPKGTRAVYVLDKGKPEEFTNYVTIVAFNDDGEPLIVANRGLEPAWHYPGFVRIDTEEHCKPPDETIVRLLPPPPDAWHCGWDDDGTVWRSPIIAVALMADGYLALLRLDADGMIWPESVNNQDNTWIAIGEWTTDIPERKQLDIPRQTKDTEAL